MKLVIATLLATTALSGVAMAQNTPKCFDKGTLTFIDCPPPPSYTDPAPVAPVEPPVIYDWSGWYVGAHAGYADVDVSGVYDSDDQSLAGQDLDVDGVSFGGQIGYNWHLDNSFVFGLELDGSYLGEDDAIASDPALDNQRLSAEVDAYGSLRGRLGVAMDEFLPFVTAGVGLVDYELAVDDVTDGYAASEDDTALALVVGGGLEWGFYRNLTLRAEGLYYYVDEDTAFAEPGDAAENVTLEDLWTIRGVLNFRF